ncbi:hypothetical protein GCM10022220_48210 [Actinocatenispora rupis]|uniref:Mutator family transposase n=1 Tax=Actinocatenispora rupis TaxID=519421 RepID=A0A8J3IYJ3_9ACTN|nr:hypothetical protein Aru02nite_32900 [Actinocatenispora rupis]
MPALEQFLGGAAGLLSATVTRLTKQWQDDHTAFQQRDLADRDFVYVWADGVHPKVRLGQAHSCVLVLLGVRLDGTKELIALAEHRRRCDGPVEGPGRGVSCCPPAEVLGSQGPECHELSSEVRTAERGEGDAGDLQRRGPCARREGDRSFHEDLRG